MLQRLTVYQKTVHVDTVLADCGEIPFTNASAGQVFVPAGSNLTTLTWYAAPVSGGTFLAVQNGAGVAVTSTVSAGICCLIPAACFGCAVLKAVGNADGTVDICLKS